MKSITVKNQLKLSIPMAFEQLVNVLMTTIDTLIVGLLGVNAVAQVGSMGTILNLLFIFPNTIMTSNNVLIANYIGAEDKKSIKYTLGNSIMFGIILGIILIIITLGLSPVFPNLFNVDKFCLKYLYIRLIGFLPLIMNDILCGYERTKGNPSFILNMKIAMLILNLIFDILVVSLGFGILGVGFVTISLDIILMIILLIRNISSVLLKFKKEIFIKIFYYVKWNIVEKLIYKLDILIMNVIVSNIGTIQYSVHVILSQVLDMYRDFISGIQNGISINVGIIQGSKKHNLYKNLKRVVMKIQSILFFLAPLVLFIISYIISNIYFKKELQIKTFYEILPIILINSIINVISIYYYAYLRGVKDFKFLANRNIISSVIKVLIAFIFSYYFGVIGVWISYFVYSFSQYFMSKKRYDKIKV